MEGSDALKGYAQKRMERLKKYFPDPIACHVTMSTERYNHRVDVNLQLHNGFKIAGHESTENMYSSIDMVTAKIERQVRRYKDKLRHRKVRAMSPVPVFHSLIEEGRDEAAAEASAVVESLPQSSPAPPSVIKREQMDAGPMSVAEAIMQLNLLHGQFYVFRNDESGQINVVYRHDSGGYGLIETSDRA